MLVLLLISCLLTSGRQQTRPLRYTTAATWATTSRRTRATFCTYLQSPFLKKCIGCNILVYLLGLLKFFPRLHGCERKELTETETEVFKVTHIRK